MKYKSIEPIKNSTQIRIAELDVAEGVSEYQVIVEGLDPSLRYAQQVENVFASFENWLLDQNQEASLIFLRCFLSDAVNQNDLLQARLNDEFTCALSVVQQAPLNGTKIALWAYVQTKVQVRLLSTGLLSVKHGVYEHLWSATATNHASNSEYQTRILLNEYIMQLAERGCTLAQDCMRTWFFVHDVDHHYDGVVKARNEVFKTQGLTPETHYIASTGIGGSSSDPRVLVQMDTYAVKGLKEGQVQFLYAKSHLNPTYEYGVSFERGVCINYGDRRHIFISGTASIDNKGEIVSPGDIYEQTHRMWENVETLLWEAKATFDQVGLMIVYLRDPADFQRVQQLYEERFPAIPRLILLASICRPGWLIEMECIAFVRTVDPLFPVL